MTESSASDVGISGLGVDFGELPLLPGEHREAYLQLHSEISGALQPRDAIDKIRINHIANLTWECLRLRRLKSAYLDSNQESAAVEILTPHFVRRFGANGYSKADDAARAWLSQNEHGIALAESLLKPRGFDRNTVVARAFFAILPDLEKIEGMAAGFESRRDRALKNYYRRREVRPRVQRLRDRAKLGACAS